MSGGGGNVAAPVPSPEERALQSEQTALLRDQRNVTQQMIQQQNLLAPHLYKQMGLSPTMDGNGNITGFNELPQDPNEAAFKELQTQTLQDALAKSRDPQQKEIDQLLKNRTLDALKGNLPVDPGLERGLKEGRATLEETLRQQVGSGYATSTPGIQALAEFDKRGEELRYGARTGALTLGEQLSASRQNGAMNNVSMTLPGMDLTDRLRSGKMAGTMGISAMPGMGMQGLASAAGGMGNALNWYGQQRGMQFEANKASAASANQFSGSLGALFGTGLMAGATVMASDRRLKDDVELIGHMPSGLPVYSYVIFGQKDIGVMADEAALLFPHAVLRIQGIDAVDYSSIH